MDTQARTLIKKKIHDSKNYGIIIIASLIAVFFLPMIGTTAGLAWNLPGTFVGWIVYILTKLCVVGLNFILFRSFMEQAKVNVKDNPYYIEANQILMRYGKILLRDPLDPTTWEHNEYRKKGTTVCIFTLLGAIGLTQAILTFDWLSMLSYFFTVVMGVLSGFIQMDTAETYWTTEYWQYAKMVERDMLKTKEGILNAEYDCPICGRGVTVLGADNCSCNNSNIQTNVVGNSSNNLQCMGNSIASNTDTAHNNSSIEKTNK